MGYRVLAGKWHSIEWEALLTAVEPLVGTIRLYFADVDDPRASHPGHLGYYASSLADASDVQVRFNDGHTITCEVPMMSDTGRRVLSHVRANSPARGLPLFAYDPVSDSLPVLQVRDLSDVFVRDDVLLGEDLTKHHQVAIVAEPQP